MKLAIMVVCPTSPAYDGLGNKTAEYRGPLDPLHGVIMGLDFDGTPAKFIEGHPDYSPTAVQDDLSLLAAKAIAGDGGDGYRPEATGNVSLATAIALDAGRRRATASSSGSRTPTTSVSPPTVRAVIRST